jgi:hypothetical protein
MGTRISGLAALVAALVGLFAPTGASATDPPLECTTNGAGNWTIRATGPSSVQCPAGGECTALAYEVIKNKGQLPDQVEILVAYDLVVAVPGSGNIFAPGAGDPLTRLGFRDFSTSVVKLNRNSNTMLFDLVGEGTKATTTSSVVVKKGSVIEACRIASLGRAVFDPNAQVTNSQEISFKGCTVNIPTNAIGEGGTATISGPNCVFVANGEPIGTGELLVHGQSVGMLTFGDAALSSGTDSCTTKVINRKLYTWCTCAAGDPIPPCP